MADRIVSVTERNMTTIVDNIDHVESQSLYGIAVVKVFMQPNASIDRAVAQITASSQTQLRQLPAGTTPPLIIAYSASSVPVMQLALSGQGLSEQRLNDYGLNFIRTQLITIPRSSCPLPLWRQTTAGTGRSESGCASVERPFCAGCSECDHPAEPDPADGHLQNRKQGVRR